MAESNAEKAAHAAMHLMKEKEVQAAALAVGGVALKVGAIVLAAPVAAPLAVSASLGGIGYGAWRWLKG